MGIRGRRLCQGDGRVSGAREASKEYGQFDADLVLERTRRILRDSRLATS
jgi:hypothetical protein